MKTISIIIPVYNEEKRLFKTFQGLSSLQLPRGLKLEAVIFVNDGSKDNSKIKIQASKTKLERKLKTKVILLSCSQNQGKGSAIRQGLQKAKADYFLLTDADLSTPLGELEKFMSYLNKGFDLIIGTRKNGQSTVVRHQPLYREILGRGYTFLSNLILGTNFNDFTCGFKVLSKEAQEKILPFLTINRWAYDSEILFLAKKMKLRIAEVPVVWSDDPDSKVHLWKDLFISFWELLRIRLSWSKKVLGIYPQKAVKPAFALIKSIQNYLL